MKTQIPQGSLISFMSTMVKQKGGINLAQGLPGFEPPSELINYLIEIAPKSIHQYPPGIGNFKILELLENQYRKFGDISKDNFLITQGATEAISLIYSYLKQLINDNFSVMAFNPAYESYSKLPEKFGQNFIEANMKEDGSFDKQEIESEIINNNVKIFFLASPGNPYGKIADKEQVDTLIEICKKNKCYLIFDAVYKEIYFENPPYIPLEQLNPFLFYVNSFSKLLSITGWRVGYLISHKTHINAIRQMHDYTGLCANSVLQEAIALYLENHNMGIDYISKLKVEFKNSFEKFSEVLINLDFEIPKIDGGYFIWSKLPQKYKNGFEVAIDLYKKTKVATVPGIHFSKSASNYIRFNIARPNSDIENAIIGVKNYFS